MTTPLEAKAFREANGLKQIEMAEKCGISLKTYTNFETGAKSTPATHRIINDVIRASTNSTSYRPANVSLLNTGVVGLVSSLNMWPLERENLFFVAEELKTAGHPIRYDVSNAIVWQDEPTETKDHLAVFQDQVDILMSSKGAAAGENTNGFLGVIAQIEDRQKACKRFSESVPKELLGRIYGAFVTARAMDEEGNEHDRSIFCMTLGESAGENWRLEFTVPANQALVDQAREFNERKLDINNEQQGGNQ